MSKGVQISSEMRHLIYSMYKFQRISPLEIWRLLFGVSNTVALSTVQKICSLFNSDDEDKIEIYLSGSARLLKGRKRKLDDFAVTVLDQITKNHSSKRLKNLTKILNNTYYGNNFNNYVSESTVCRTLMRKRITRKKVEKRHIRQNPTHRAQYLEFISRIHPRLLVNIDETLSNVTEYEERYGYAPVGDAAEKKQLVIQGISYSVIAAYSDHGFLDWEIYEGTISQIEFQHYLEHKISKIVGLDSVGLIDNAKIHVTERSLDCLERVFEGNYIRLPEYSSDLAPIEKGFSNIKEYLRQFEEDVIENPIELINEAFFRYSFFGPHSYAGTLILQFIIFVISYFNSIWKFSKLQKQLLLLSS